MNGVDGAGKGDAVNLFNEWMDPRYIRTHAFGALTDDERDAPASCGVSGARSPPKGRIGIYFGNWYTDPIVEARDARHEKGAQFEQRLQRIRHFERTLVDEGALIIKLWFHLSKPAQKQRFKELLSSKRHAWRVTNRDLGAFQALRRASSTSASGRCARPPPERRPGGHRGHRSAATATSPWARPRSTRSRAAR